MLAAECDSSVAHGQHLYSKSSFNTVVVDAFLKSGALSEKRFLKNVPIISLARYDVPRTSGELARLITEGALQRD